MFTDKPELLLISDIFKQKTKKNERLSTEELMKRIENTLGSIAKKKD